MKSDERLISTLKRVRDVDPERLALVIGRIELGEFNPYTTKHRNHKAVLRALLLRIDRKAFKEILRDLKQGFYDPTPAEVGRWLRSTEGRAAISDTRPNSRVLKALRYAQQLKRYDRRKLR